MTGFVSLSTGRSPLAARADDLYQTPPEATAALLEAENLPQRLWEPACGPGAIVDVLRGSGRQVIASDLVDYGATPIGAHWRRDFLMESKAPEGTQAIVTNPPFKLGAQFVRHALTLAPLVIMLLRLAFLESETRSDLLDGGQLARVLVFKNRLPMMHRADYDGPKNGSAIAFAWFVWDRNNTTPTMLKRLSWVPLCGKPRIEAIVGDPTLV